MRTTSCVEGYEEVGKSVGQMEPGDAMSDPAVDWVDDLVDWANGHFDECTRGGGGHRKFRATVEQFGVAPAASWKDCVANLKQFGRDTKLHEVLGDGDGEYVPPHILGIQGLKKACKKYKIRYSDATRSKVVAEVLAAQLRELGARGQAEEEDEEVSLPDSRRKKRRRQWLQPRGPKEW